MTSSLNGFIGTTTQMASMALRYLGGRRLRTALTTLAIVCGVAMIFAVNLVLPSALTIFDRAFSATSGAADVSIITTTGESFAPNSAIETVSAVANVDAVSGVLRREFPLPTLVGTGENAPQVELIGIDPDTASSVREYVVTDGRFLEAGDTGKALLPANVAQFTPQLHVGTTFPLVTAAGLRIYTVVGLVADQPSTSALPIYVTLEDAQSALDQPGLINTLNVAIAPDADRDGVSADILKALGSGYQLDSSSPQSSIGSATGMAFIVMNTLGALALFMGAFLIFNTFRTIVVERRHDLAMLRTLGATRQQLTLLILIESLVQGVLGTVLGLFIGCLLAVVMSAGANNIIQSYISNFSLSPQISLSAVASASLMGILTALVAGYWPARAAGRISPLEALRLDSAASVKRGTRWGLIVGVVVMVAAALMILSGSQRAVGGALLFLIGMVLAAPGLVMPAASLFSPLLSLGFAREGDLARGNLIRQPGRAAITASTLMIGLAVLVLMGALASSMSQMVEKMANQNFTSDIILMPPTIGVYSNVMGADESLDHRLRALPDVETVASLRYATTNVGDNPLEVLGINPSDYVQVGGLDFVDGQANDAYISLTTGRNAIITALAMQTLKVDVGSDLVMETANGPQMYRVVGIAHDLLSFKLNAVYVSQENMRDDFHKTEDVLVMINLKPGVDETAALAAVQAVVADYPQFTARSTSDFRDELVGITKAASTVIYGVAFLILIPAALGLLNTLTINVLERTREIGVLRAVGSSRAQVRRIVTAESLLLGIFGAAMGVLAGVAMSYGVISTISSIGWQLPYEFPIVGIVAAIVVAVLLALFAAVLPARSAAKLDIIRALQYQ